MLPDSLVPPPCFVAAATIFLVAKRLLKLCGEREMWRMIWYSNIGLLSNISMNKILLGNPTESVTSYFSVYT